MTKTDKSKIFTAYNKVRARERKMGGIFGVAYVDRVDRGLGLAQSKEERPYVTTSQHCNCGDRHHRGYRGVTCKHMRQIQILEAAGITFPLRPTNKPKVKRYTTALTDSQRPEIQAKKAASRTTGKSAQDLMTEMGF